MFRLPKFSATAAHAALALAAIAWGLAKLSQLAEAQDAQVRDLDASLKAGGEQLAELDAQIAAALETLATLDQDAERATAAAPDTVPDRWPARENLDQLGSQA